MSGNSSNDARNRTSERDASYIKSQSEHSRKSPKKHHHSKMPREPRTQREGQSRPRRSRSSDYNDTWRTRGREKERKTSGSDRRIRGRSLDMQKRTTKGNSGSHRPNESTASPHSHYSEETECPVCFCAYDNVFKTPKLLSCGHTFCLECLARINVNCQELKELSCPICREVTQLPHGRDLPHLDNNQEVFQKLPSDMQRVVSVRFKRSKGRLELKNKSNSSNTCVSLPAHKGQHMATTTRNPLSLAQAETGEPVTSVYVGRPPNRLQNQVQRLCHSSHCYYIVLALVIVLVVALMLVGVLVFVVLPRVTYTSGGVHPPPGNGTTPYPGNLEP